MKAFNYNTWIVILAFSCLLIACAAGMDCPAGWYAEDGICKLECPEGMVEKNGECDSDPSYWVDGDQSADGDLDDDLRTDGDESECEEEELCVTEHLQCKDELDNDDDGQTDCDDSDCSESAYCIAKLRCLNSLTQVLFLGNSYTDTVDIPGLVSSFASAYECLFLIDSNTPAGYSFTNHRIDATSLAKIEAESWEVVVLQNQSQMPGFRPEDVMASSLVDAQALVDAIRENDENTRPLYFVTWGRRDGDLDNCEYYELVCTFDGHTQALEDGYNIYLDATGGELARVGRAWQAVVHDPDAPFDAAGLWSDDGSHPSLSGSYLAAAVIFANIFQLSPVGNTYLAGLPEIEAGYLQKVAERFWLCGNGQLDEGEECDDGRQTETCEANCRVAI